MKKPKAIEARSLVSGRNLEPYISLHTLYDDGTEDQIKQWTPAEAYNHAMAVLGCVEAANTDAFLVAFLVERIGLDLQKATSVLPDFRAWRERRKISEKTQ